MKDFIQTFIHSLRSPLTAVFSNIELLTKGYVGNVDNDTREILNEILFNAHYMEVIMRNVSDILEYENTEEIVLQEVSFNEIIENIVVNLQTNIINIEELFKVSMNEHLVVKSIADMTERMFLVIIFELLKFANQENILQLEAVYKKNTLFINFYYTYTANELFDPEKIFDEIFFNPVQKHCKMNLLFFDMVFKLINAEKKLLTEEKNYVFQLIIK